MMDNSDNTIQLQLVEMGFTQAQAEIAVQHIEYPDINLAAEWILT